jgi:hypothetical protein
VFENTMFDPRVSGKDGFFYFLVREGISQEPVNWKFPSTSEQRKLGEVHVLTSVPIGSGDEKIEIVINTIKTALLGKTIITSPSNLYIRIQTFTGDLAGESPPWYQKLAVMPFIASYN